MPYSLIDWIFRTTNVATAAAVGTVDPIVGAPGQTIDAQLLVAWIKTGEQHVAPVGLAVAVGVLKQQDVGRGGDQQSAADGEHAGGKRNIIGEVGRRFVRAVAVAIFEQADVPLVGPKRIVVHFGHEQPARRVPGHGHGADHGRLGGDQLDHQVVIGQLEGLCCSAAGAKRISGIAAEGFSAAIRPATVKPAAASLRRPVLDRDDKQ